MNNAVEDRSLLSFGDSSADLGYTIAVLRPYIEERVTIHHLLPEMKCISRKAYSQIYENRSDNKKAADIFFNHLKELEDPGKYQDLLSALENGNYPLIVSVIKDGKINTVDAENLRLIELFLKRLADAITPDIMSQELQQRQIIESYEGDKIRNLTRYESPYDAALYLLSRIHCRKTSWYPEFLEVLWGMDLRELVKDIDDKYYGKMINESNQDLDSLPSIASADQGDYSFPQPAVTEPVASVAVGIPLSSEQPQQANTSWQSGAAADTSDSSNFTQAVLTQLAGLTAQLTQQIDSLALVSIRLETLEGKVDQILQRL